MTDKPIDLSAREARYSLRRILLNSYYAPELRFPTGHVKTLLDALDARETLVVAGNRQKFTMAQAEDSAGKLEQFVEDYTRTPEWYNPDECGPIITDAARMIRYFAASLDAANVRYENSNQHLGDTVKSFLWVQELQSKYKGNALLEPLLTKHWGGQIGKLAEELVDLLFAKVANLEKLNDDLLECHSAYVLANPAPIRLEGGQVVRFVSPVTPNEVQILSEEPFAMAEQTVAAEIDHFEITGQAETILPVGVDMLATAAIMPEIADTPPAQEAIHTIRHNASHEAGGVVESILPPLPEPMTATPDRILAATQVLEDDLNTFGVLLALATKYDTAKRMLLAAGLREA